MAAKGAQDKNPSELNGEAQEQEKQISVLLNDSNLRDLLPQTYRGRPHGQTGLIYSADWR